MKNLNWLMSGKEKGKGGVWARYRPPVRKTLGPPSRRYSRTPLAAPARVPSLKRPFRRFLSHRIPRTILGFWQARHSQGQGGGLGGMSQFEGAHLLCPMWSGTGGTMNQCLLHPRGSEKKYAPTSVDTPRSTEVSWWPPCLDPSTGSLSARPAPLPQPIFKVTPHQKKSSSTKPPVFAFFRRRLCLSLWSFFILRNPAGRPVFLSQPLRVLRKDRMTPHLDE